MPRTQVIEHPYRPHKYQSELHELMAKKRFGVVVCHRRFGKTYWAVNTLIQAALSAKKPESRFAYIAPYYGQAKQVSWDYLKKFLYMIPGVSFHEAELRADLPNGARIRLYGGDNPDSIRGIYLDGVVMDEVADMRPNLWDEVIRPTLADRKGWAIFIGTVKGVDLLYRLYREAEERPDWFNKMYRVDQTDLLEPEEIERLRGTMSASSFAREFLCDFSATSDDVLISLGLALQASERNMNDAEVRGAIKVIGVDVAGAGTGRDKTVFYPVQGLKAFEPVILEGAETGDIVNALIRLTQTFEPDHVRIDVGFNPGVAEMYKQYGYQCTKVHFGGRPRDAAYLNVRAEIWDGLRKWLEAGGSIPKRETLIEQLASVRIKPETGNHKMRLVSKNEMAESPDEGDALALAVGVPLRAITKNIENKSQGLKTIKKFEKKDTRLVSRR